MAESLGVAVIGAGMAGKAHAAAYRTASTLYSPVLPQVRLVSIGDVNAEFGSLAARRFGYERNDTSWQAIAEADDIDVVSVVIETARTTERRRLDVMQAELNRTALLELMQAAGDQQSARR